MKKSILFVLISVFALALITAETDSEDIIEKQGYLVPLENLKLRKEPSVESNTGLIFYEYELMSLSDDKYSGSQMFNKDYAIRCDSSIDEDTISSDVLLAGMIKEFSAVTTKMDTIDGITAPWYRISFRKYYAGEGLDYYWIFGGYVQEISNPETKEYEKLFIDSAVEKGYLIPKDQIKRNSEEIQAETVLLYAEPIYKLSSLIRVIHDRTHEKQNYSTIYYLNNNCTYSTVVELINNDLLSSSKLKIGMKKQAVLDLLGEPKKSTNDTISYDTFKFTEGFGYKITFTFSKDTVSSIEVSFEK